MRKHIRTTVALAALAGDKNINQVATQYEVHPTQITKWRDAAKQALPEQFTNKRKKNGANVSQAQIDELHRVIGVRDTELEWHNKLESFGLFMNYRSLYIT